MKLGDFPIVEALVSTRNYLIGLRDEGRITVEIDGRGQPQDFVDAVVPGIRLELARRIGDTEQQIRQYGVVTD